MIINNVNNILNKYFKEYFTFHSETVTSIAINPKMKNIVATG
jgi:hypothetical protein